MGNRKAFTLIEVLISIALLGLILVPLFSVVEMMKRSNEHLLKSVERSKQVTKATKVLYMDILSSNGKLKIKKDEFTRLCIDETTNSLYHLPTAKVCWVVLKEKNTLVRVEGNAYHMPLKSEEHVEVDSVIQGLELFDVYHDKDKVLVLIQEKGKEPISFLLQGITNPVLKVLADGTQIMRDGRKILPNGTQVFKDGSKILPDGTLIPAPKKHRGPKSGSGNQKGKSNQNTKGRTRTGSNSGNTVPQKER
ncbi:MAG: prepilin-type cleavage/methylation domain-containing protein [Sulfurovum sp.]|nr:MAG: prepilin-type cleavage/methylation domain-containing protein [Sulfurovum sp.]